MGRIGLSRLWLGMDSYERRVYIYIFALFFYFFFQPGAVFLAICCILELKSVFCMHFYFGARISHLRAHLAFFGFWLLVLVSLGFGF